MKDPIQYLTDIWKDPVELASIAIPSMTIAYAGILYRDKIHPELNRLPSPTGEGTEQAYGFILFVFVTLLLATMIKRASHDILNPAYDTLYRDRRRKREETNYSRAI